MILCAVAFAAPAGAADLRMPVKAPVLPPAFSWSGCYLGGHVGGAFADRDPLFTDVGNANFRSFSGGVTAGRVENDHSWNVPIDSSVIAGGTLGCNWQQAGSSWVFGLEGEAGYMRLKGAAFDPLINPTTTVAAFRGTPDSFGSEKAGDWYGMITGRLGYAFDRTLIYAKGGAAFLRLQSSVVDVCTNTAGGCGNWLIATDEAKTITTGTLGGGIEWAMANNWSIKGEYMFIGLGGGRTITSCGSATTATGATVGGGPFCFNHQFGGVHTAKLGLNFRFGP